MIKIRYRDPRELAPGLYAAAERHSRGTTVYLLPGLSVAQRRAALRRGRIRPAGVAARGCPRPSSRWRCWPTGSGSRLRAGGRRPSRRSGGQHRAGHGRVGRAIAFLLFSTVSIRVLPTTPASPEAASSPGPAASAGAGAVPFAGSQGGVTGLGGSGDWQAVPPGLGGSSLAASPGWPGRP